MYINTIRQKVFRTKETLITSFDMNFISHSTHDVHELGTSIVENHVFHAEANKKKSTLFENFLHLDLDSVNFKSL